VILRGTDGAAGSLFSCVDLEARIPGHHPLREVRQVVTDALSRLDADFDRLFLPGVALPSRRSG